MGTTSNLTFNQDESSLEISYSEGQDGIDRVESMRILGANFGNTLSVTYHVDELVSPSSKLQHAQRIGLLRNHGLSK